MGLDIFIMAGTYPKSDTAYLATFPCRRLRASIASISATECVLPSTSGHIITNPATLDRIGEFTRVGDEYVMTGQPGTFDLTIYYSESERSMPVLKFASPDSPIVARYEFLVTNGIAELRQYEVKMGKYKLEEVYDGGYLTSQSIGTSKELVTTYYDIDGAPSKLNVYPYDTWIRQYYAYIDGKEYALGCPRDNDQSQALRINAKTVQLHNAIYVWDDNTRRWAFDRKV